MMTSRSEPRLHAVAAGRQAGALRLGVAAVVLLLGGLAVQGTPTGRPAVASPAGGTRDSLSLAGILQQPVSLDVAPDGRVYLSDPGPGGVHVLHRWGRFTGPIGATEVGPGRLGAPGHLAVGPVPDTPDSRLYVEDTATRRIVVYDLDGRFVAAWPGIRGAGIAAAGDGRVYVADRGRYQVLALDHTGRELYAFGWEGESNGGFSSFNDVAVSPDGTVLAVADLRGKRVQLFDLPANPQMGSATLRRVYRLDEPRYTNATNKDLECRATIVHALGGDTVWVGEGNGACRIMPSEVVFAIPQTANGGTVCKPTVRLVRLRPASEQYYGLASYDPNAGPCGSKRTELPLTPVVLWYADAELRRVLAAWPAAAGWVGHPSDDSMVQSSQPSKSFGGEKQLQIRSTAEEVTRSYLKFEVSGLVGRPVRTATLWLFAPDGGDAGGTVHQVANTLNTGGEPWTQANLTWANAPFVAGSPLDAVDEVPDGHWVGHDVSAAVRADGTYSFALGTDSDDGLTFNSREAAERAPLLLVDFAVSVAPTPNLATAPADTATPPPTTATPEETTPTSTPTGTGSTEPTPTPTGPTPTRRPTRTATATLSATGFITQVLTPVADARVISTEPERNYGFSDELRLGTEPDQVLNSYLKFEIPEAAAPIRAAVLRLHVANGSNHAGVAHVVGNTFAGSTEPWTERGITWSNAPPIDAAPLDTQDLDVAVGTWVQFNVSAAVTGAGTISFGLNSPSSDRVYYASKDAAANPPALWLLYYAPGAPTASPTGATAAPTAMPTAPGHPMPIHLPLLMRQACQTRYRYQDIVLIIDASSAMDGDRLTELRLALSGFLDAIALGQDRVGIVSYNSRATLVQSLTGTRPLLDDALRGLTTASGNRADLGLRAAVDELRGPRHNPTSGRLAILLSAGRPTDRNEVLAAGELLRVGRVELYTIGFGSSTDVGLLKAIATDPQHYAAAESRRDLGPVYQDVAARIGCT